MKYRVTAQNADGHEQELTVEANTDQSASNQALRQLNSWRITKALPMDIAPEPKPHRTGRGPKVLQRATISDWIADAAGPKEPKTSVGQALEAARKREAGGGGRT